MAGLHEGHVSGVPGTNRRFGTVISESDHYEMDEDNSTSDSEWDEYVIGIPGERRCRQHRLRRKAR